MLYKVCNGTAASFWGVSAKGGILHVLQFGSRLDTGEGGAACSR
jgi:hypothetical protein